MSEEVESQCYNLSALFISEDYVEKDYIFSEYHQTLLCSQMSSTDHDLTGQIIWPAAEILCWYIYHHLIDFKSKNVIELGAGTGLAGFFVSQFCERTMITDGNDIVVRLLNRNNNELNSFNKSVITSPLIWGCKSRIRDLFDTHSFIPDIIIGADIILWPDSVTPLVQTLRWLLSFKPISSYAIISYIVRAHTTTELFLTTCIQYNLLITTTDSTQYLPQPIPSKFSDLGKQIFRVTLAPPTPTLPAPISTLRTPTTTSTPGASDVDHDLTHLKADLNLNLTSFESEPEEYSVGDLERFNTHMSAC